MRWIGLIVTLIAVSAWLTGCVRPKTVLVPPGEPVQIAEDAEAYAARFPAARLRSAEECAYHKLLCEAYDNSPLVLDNVARWSDRPDELGLDGEHRVEPMGSGT